MGPGKYLPIAIVGMMHEGGTEAESVENSRLRPGFQS
jgi:hypothetical protein